jgi:hypothetical protein
MTPCEEGRLGARESLAEHLALNIPSKMAFVNITPQVAAAVRKCSVQEGLVLVSTTARAARKPRSPTAQQAQAAKPEGDTKQGVLDLVADPVHIHFLPGPITNTGSRLKQAQSLNRAQPPCARWSENASSTDRTRPLE